MPIRKGRFHRPCKGAGCLVTFLPSKAGGWVCPNCVLRIRQAALKKRKFNPVPHYLR